VRPERAATVIAALVLACSTAEITGPNESIQTILVAPSTATVAVGATLSLDAEVRTATGDVIGGQRVSWSSEDAGVAEVSSTGVVTGLSVGTVLIAASARGHDAFARVTVNPTPVASVRLSSTHQSLLVGQVAQLTAEPLDASGRLLANRQVTWTSSDVAIATVTESGLVTALSPGGAIITATAEGRSAIASITVAAIPIASVVVTPAVNDLFLGQTTQLTAEARDASDRPLPDRVIVWATSRPLVATVTSEGLVTAISSGTATITATSEGRSATATVNVTPRPVSSVVLSPEQATLQTGQTLQLTVSLTDDQGQALTGRQVSFATSNVQVATVSATGLVTGVAPGTVMITASSEGMSGTASLTVTPEPVASVDIFPANGSIVVGSTLQLFASPRNALGQTLTGRTITWSSGAPGLASVSATGLVTGLTPGNAVVLASVEGKQGSALIIVRQVPVASITINPASVTVLLGQSVTLGAQTLDAAGNVLAGRVVGWSSSDQNVATVSNNGVVTGVAAGTVTISASSEGQTGVATVQVNFVGGVATTVVVSPAQANLPVGQKVQLSAVVRDANGTLLSSAPVTWSTSSTSRAVVSSTGLVTGVSAGTVTITARSGSANGTATITVQALVAVDRIIVTPKDPSIDVGKTVQLTATLLDKQDNVLTGRTVTWTSSDQSRATVSNTGLVSGIRGGTVTITASSGGKSGTTSVRVR
jgi:trimeric autotransporter adhesin